MCAVTDASCDTRSVRSSIAARHVDSATQSDRRNDLRITRPINALSAAADRQLDIACSWPCSDHDSAAHVLVRLCRIWTIKAKSHETWDMAIQARDEVFALSRSSR